MFQYHTGHLYFLGLFSGTQVKFGQYHTGHLYFPGLLSGTQIKFGQYHTRHLYFPGLFLVLRLSWSTSGQFSGFASMGKWPKTTGAAEKHYYL